MKYEKDQKILTTANFLSIHSIQAIILDKILITSKCNQIQIQVQ
jgi:hypothetical protein